MLDDDFMELGDNLGGPSAFLHLDKREKMNDIELVFQLLF
jgi:hypothetical protein